LLEKKDIEILVTELWEYWKTLGTIDEISKSIFEVIELSKKDNIDEDEYKKWVMNLKNTERFAWLNNIISDNVYSHQVRLSELVDELSFFLELINIDDSNDIKINIPYISTLALIHDDVEWVSILKDIPTIIKLALSENSKKILSIIDESCIDLLSKHHYGHLKMYSSKDLKSFYLDSENKITLEWQLLSFLDKIDWFMFTLHELFNWNRDFLEPFGNYLKILKDIKNNKNKYPEIRFLLDWNISDFKEKVNRAKWWFDDEEFDYDEIYFKKWSDRSVNVLDLFDIDKLLEIENKLDYILNYKVVNKKYEYQVLADADNLYPEFDVDVITTDIPSYESWKITFAKMYYFNNDWKVVNWYDVMYSE